MAQATKGTPVKSMPPGSQVRAAHPESLTVGSHGILRLMNRPAQWVITITLLISWSFAGVILFDFVSEDQIASIQDFGNDPMLAVNKALEGIEHRMNLMNDMFNNAQEYVTAMIYNPKEAAHLAAGSSVSYLSGIFSAEEDSVFMETAKHGGSLLDEATEWIRSPVVYSFNLFEDILNLLFTPVDLLSEAAVHTVNAIKTIIQYISNILKGNKGAADLNEIAQVCGTLLDEVTDWIRTPVGYVFHLFEDVLEVAVLSPADVASDAFLQILSVIKSKLSDIFGHLEAWFPTMTTTFEDAKKTDTEDGVPEVTFNPMKVVTDTVEEFTDTRDALLAYLSNILMEDKDDTPQVLRRKGEFLPPMEKVLEEVKEAKEKKAREEIYKIIQEMREEKNEREEEEIVLQQINKTVETVRKQEMDKKEAKISRKEKKDAVKVQEPAEFVAKEKVEAAPVEEEAVSLKEPASKRKEAELLKEKLKPALEKKYAEVVKDKHQPVPKKKEVEIKKPKPAFVKIEADLIKEETKPTLKKKEAEVKVKVEPALEKKEAEEEKEKVKPDLAKKVDAMKKKVRRAPVMKGAEVIKEKDKPAPEKKGAEVIKEKEKPAPEQKVAEVTKEKVKPTPEKKGAEVIKEKDKPAPEKKGAEVIKEKDKHAPEKKVAEVIKEKDKPAPVKKGAEAIKEKDKPAPEKKVAKVIKEKVKPAPEKKVAEVIKEKVKPAPEKKVAEVIKEKVKPAPEKIVAEILKEAVGSAPMQKAPEISKERSKPTQRKVIQVEAEKVVLAAPAKKEPLVLKEKAAETKPAPAEKVRDTKEEVKAVVGEKEITKEKPRAPPKKEAVQEKAEAHAPTEEDAGLIGLDLELLNSINQKLSLLDLLRKDIGEMKSDLESTQNQITLLRMDNRTITELKPTAVKTKTAASREKARVARKDQEALMNVTKTANIKAEHERLKNITKAVPTKKDKVAPKVKVTSEPKEKEIIPKKAVEEKEPLKKEPNQVSEEVVDQTEKKVTVEQVKEEPEVPKDIPVVEEEDVPYFQCFFVDEDDTQYPFFPFSPPVW